MSVEFIKTDCLDWLRGQPDASVDLVFGSPPYEAARTYGIGFNLVGQDWVDWMVERMREMARVSRGLVALVVEGQTRKFRWSATPALLMADLHRAGLHLRKPPIFHRVGVPGSGGPDWLRNDYEIIVCCQARPGKLPWSDNTALGHTPKWAPGGEMSSRLSNGTRRNQFGGTTGTRSRKADGERTTRYRPSHRPHTKAKPDGTMEVQQYAPPVKANPGNVIKCLVGGGVMGDRLCHENEAPFPEKLAEFFVRSFCPPGGLVLDPFCGSGTTAAVALASGRRAVAIDVRSSMIELARRRCGKVTRPLELV